MTSAQYGLMTAVVAAMIVGFVAVTGAAPADFINSALMTVTPVLAPVR
jgi:hypothetical protein